MPIYAYRCDACGFAKDALQKVSDAPLTDCPSCGQPAFKKQLTAAGFQLKGTGWYVTDFRGGNKPAAPVNAPAANADAVPASGATAATPADSKAGSSDSAAATPAATTPTTSPT
ncbi:MAG TPA: FmdB family transcriptional regulator [Oxalobacteraceae bacterium]|jgi:putative FmdB family regulatory protein|nr:FmdB family transcriptional regulator [Oxalobacteraceae bacterium]HCN90515.1 FmdB family transcriptional regulator [Oxalobacteraceae bacterium]